MCGHNSDAIFTNWFDSIHTVYDILGVDTTIIKVQMIDFPENADFNAGKIITVKCGYDCSFFASTYCSTIIGSLTITSGELTISNIVIQ